MQVSLKSLIAIALVASTALLNAGCSSIAELKASARADREAHPEKYKEDPEVVRQQMTANQNGPAYPQFCTWTCPIEQPDLTRNW